MSAASATSFDPRAVEHLRGRLPVGSKPLEGIACTAESLLATVQTSWRELNKDQQALLVALAYPRDRPAFPTILAARLCDALIVLLGQRERFAAAVHAIQRLRFAIRDAVERSNEELQSRTRGAIADAVPNADSLPGSTPEEFRDWLDRLSRKAG